MPILKHILNGLLLFSGLGVVAQLLSFEAEAISHHVYNGNYTNEYTSRDAFPIGGIGAGMFCLEGTGSILHLSIRHRPAMYDEPPVFAAIAVRGLENSARVLEGPVPTWKKYGELNSALRMPGATWGLRRFEESDFLARFPFAEIDLLDKGLPLDLHITGWSPFIPTDADNSSLPVGALEYRFKNTGSNPHEYVFSYNARNFLAIRKTPNRIKPYDRGFILSQDSTTVNPDWQADFAIFTDDPATVVNPCWFRSGWFDPIAMVWNDIEKCVVRAGVTQTDAVGASYGAVYTSARRGEDDPSADGLVCAKF